MAKKRKPEGWRDEPERHSLAARGMTGPVYAKKITPGRVSISGPPWPRFNKYGDTPDGRHITEFEDADLTPSERHQKHAALAEGHEEDYCPFCRGPCEGYE